MRLAIGGRHAAGEAAALVAELRRQHGDDPARLAAQLDAAIFDAKTRAPRRRGA